MYVALQAESGDITTVTLPRFKPFLIARLNKIPEEWTLIFEPSFIKSFTKSSNSFNIVGSPPWNVISPLFLAQVASSSSVNYHALKVRGFLLGAESTFSE